MVSSCVLLFNETEIVSQKAYVPDEFLYLFQESDRQELVPNEDEFEIRYRADRYMILQRLDLAGITVEFCRNHFDEWRTKKCDDYEQLVKDGEDWAASEVRLLQALNYDEWKSRIPDVILTRYNFPQIFRDEIDRRMKDISGDGWLFYAEWYETNYNILPRLRSILEAVPDIGQVSLDITGLITGGWIPQNAKICENARSPDVKRRSILEPAVIITEGSIDILVLQKSVERLYPYLRDYVAFFDYNMPNLDGGASYLGKFIRAFAAARMNTKILAVFDNDAIGCEALDGLRRVTLPPNIRVMRLPDSQIARSYPTLGPQGTHEIDVNGKAVSIEFFLGRQNLLTSDGSLIPVVWSNYVKAVNVYQGAIMDKRAVLDRFLEDISQERNIDDARRRFPELAALWDEIFRLLQ
jgi:hypothetical protein